LKGLVGLKVTELYIWNNQITSLEGLAGSNISNNLCYQQFKNEFQGSIQKVKEYYGFNEVKNPGFD
jgi:hypothetical protein